jgi:hypothetical protein
MPTPKEKAEELVEKYYWTFGDGYLGEQHIQCALIAVDEIINDLKESLEIAEGLHPHAKGLISGSLVAWQKVKIEIEKL